MCEICRRKHKKIFWLSQYKEMEWQAQQIIKTMSSPHHRINVEIEEYFAGIIKSKEELFDKILEIIKDETTPRENDKAQLELF